MEKSDDYIDFKAYTRYLRRVTGEPADPEALRKTILSKTAETTEMQTAYVILKRLVAAAALLLTFSLVILFFKVFSKA